MTSPQLVPAVLVSFIVWRVYVRVRRNIGRQPFRRSRMITSIVLFSFLSVGIGIAASVMPLAVAGLGAGLVAGGLLALLGLRLTVFDLTAETKYYTPNTFLGISITALFLGRMIYRATVLYAVTQPDSLPPPLFHSPLTLVLFGITAGYYIGYCAGVLHRCTRPATPPV